MSEETKTYGAFKRYFRTRNYGFIEIHDLGIKADYPADIFFHLDHIANNIPLERIVPGQQISFTLKKVKQGWAADDICLIDS